MLFPIAVFINIDTRCRTMTVAHSEDVLLENIYVSSRSYSASGVRNTDGADTLASNRITFRGWEVDNGDDSICEHTACIGVNFNLPD
jgi:galacturan 1,4-alpha-galacturonidase